MSQTPAASVIIPVLNGESTIGTLLTALQNQAGGHALEIIVVDNGSTDRTMEIVRNFGATVLQQPVRGPSAARNMGWQHARAEILLHADADTIPTRRWVTSFLEIFSNPVVYIAGGPILGWQPKTAAERYCSARPAYLRENSIEHPRYPFVIGMNLAVRRKHTMDIGGWDETLTSGEDVDFSFRLRQQFGGKLHYAEGAVIFHQHRCTDDALCKQAQWHGAGLALFQQRHSDVYPWTVWHSAVTRLSLGLLHLGIPIGALAKATGLINAKRAEFEHYHRLWTCHFWSGFFKQRKKLSA